MASVASLASNGFSALSGQPYIHYDRRNFFKNVKTAQIVSLSDKERLAMYNEQMALAKSKYSAAVPQGFSFEEYQEIMETVTELLQNTLTGPGQSAAIAELRKTISMRKSINLSGLSRNSKGEYSAKLKELTKEIDKMESIADSINNLLNQYRKVDATAVRLKEQKGFVGSINPDDLYILKDEKAAMTSWKNINNALRDLQKIISSVKASGGTSIAKGDDAKAMEIVRKFNGQLNQIQGLGYEAILAAILDEDVMKSKVESAIFSKLSASGVTVGGIDASKGQSKVADAYLTRKTTDLGFKVHIDKSNLQGSFEINLSAKSMPKLTENGLKKTATTYKSGRPWSRIGQELGLLNTAFDYYFSNLVVKPTARSRAGGSLKDGKEAFLAMKNYISVAYALQAIGGTGIGDDMVTHVVYLNKIMSVVDVISSLAKKGTQLDMTLNPSSIVQDNYFIEGDPMTQKYVRSKNVISAVRRITFTFKK